VGTVARLLNDIKITEQDADPNQNEWVFGENGEYQGTSMEHEEALHNIEHPGVEQYEWSFDNNGDLLDITNEYEDMLQSQHESRVEDMKAINSVGGKMVDFAFKKDVDGYSSSLGSDLADKINSNPELLDKQVALGENFAEAMSDMSGATPYGRDIIDEINHDAQQYTEIPETQDPQLEGQISFDESKTPTSREQLNNISNADGEAIAPNANIESNHEQISFNFDR
jgi:hypothetical protein